MGRAPRIQFPGAYYHIISRGNERRNIFSDDWDRKKFLALLKEYSTRFTIIHYCYVLMDNHYHLVLKTPLGNLSRFMHSLNSTYSIYYNYRHAREGHLLQGRYRAILVDSDNYLLKLIRYIHLNPVRAGIVSAPEDYLWSSYPGYIGKGIMHPWINYGDLYAYFSGDLKEARRDLLLFTSSPSDQLFLDAVENTKRDVLWRMVNLGEYQAEVIESAPNRLFLDSDPGTATQTVTQLDQVDKPTLDLDGVATWSNVGGATGYLVQLYSNGDLIDDAVAADGTVGVNFYGAITGEGFGTYTVQVTALGNGYLVWDSLPSDHSDPVEHKQLDQVTGLEWDYDGGEPFLKWDAVTGADEYLVTLYKGGTFVRTTTTGDLWTYIFPVIPPGGLYYATVRALGAGLYLDGPVSGYSDVMVVSEPMTTNGAQLQSIETFQNGLGPGPMHIAQDPLPFVNSWFVFNGDAFFYGVMQVERYAQSALAPPSGKTAAGIFLDIELEEGMYFAELVNVFGMRVNYDPGLLPQGMLEDTLRLYRYADGSWELLESGVDTGELVVWASVENTSTFGVFGEMAEPPVEAAPAPADPGRPTPRTMGYLPWLILAGALITVLGVVLFIRRKSLADR